MDTRYQVFISSTYTDLREERQAVLSALLQLDAIPAGMELFPAADEDAWALISRVIDECDYYPLLIGGRYGTVDMDGLSFTEREYDYATGKRKPVMAFLHGRPDDIPMGKSQKEPDLRGKLERFRSKVEQSKHVKYWMSAEQLAGQVALTFASFVKRYPAAGWIRADQVASAEALAEINGLRKLNEELTRQLERSRTELPAGSEHLAKGDERYTLAIDLRFEILGDLPKDAEGNILAAVQHSTFYVNLTWNEILQAIGPMMMDEAPERELRGSLAKWIISEREEDLDEELFSWIARIGYEYEGPGGRNHIGTVSEHQFGTIVVQLKALGIIERSRRSRSVKDTNAYWKLTPYGDTQVTKLIAIQSHATGNDTTDMTSG